MMQPHQLATANYIELQKILHAAPRGYGGRGDKWTATVIAVGRAYDCQSILDYGCGQGSLARKLLETTRHFSVREYDPAIEGKDGPPSFADLVVCTDVLEHIEPDYLDAVLQHLRELARRAVFVVISLKTTAKILADGRNAHLIVKPRPWWKQRLKGAGFALKPPPACARQKLAHEYVAVLEP